MRFSKYRLKNVLTPHRPLIKTMKKLRIFAANSLKYSQNFKNLPHIIFSCINVKKFVLVLKSFGEFKFFSFCLSFCGNFVTICAKLTFLCFTFHSLQNFLHDDMRKVKLSPEHIVESVNFLHDDMRKV